MLETGRQANGVPFTLLHMDNAKSHNSTSNLEQMMQLGFKRASHPPYSADIEPSDFFPFGWLKGELARRPLFKMEDVFQTVSEILENLTIDIIRSAFLDWIE
jgi:hypothetical protein